MTWEDLFCRGLLSLGKLYVNGQDDMIRKPRKNVQFKSFSSCRQVRTGAIVFAGTSHWEPSFFDGGYKPGHSERSEESCNGAPPWVNKILRFAQDDK